MKFLVLALCVCAASAASVSYKPWQAAQRGVQASAQAVVTVPETFVKAAEPIARAVLVGPAVKNAASEVDATIVRSENDVAANGFNSAYETSNGIFAESSGTLKRVDDTEVLVIRGSYKYIKPDGTIAEVNYIADENGFQPQSDDIPVGPAIPEEIARSLRFLAEHPPKVEKY